MIGRGCCEVEAVEDVDLEGDGVAMTTARQMELEVVAKEGRGGSSHCSLNNVAIEPGGIFLA